MLSVICVILSILCISVVYADNMIVSVNDNSLHMEDAETFAMLMNIVLVASNYSEYIGMSGIRTMDGYITYYVGFGYADTGNLLTYNNSSANWDLIMCAVAACGNVSENTSWHSDILCVMFGNKLVIYDTSECREFVDDVLPIYSDYQTMQWLADNAFMQIP